MSKTHKWKMSRAGLLNFWYYDYEVFDFSDGKLLLRGSNGSGKSVTMQSFLPVLLDGKKSPDRLDPFGSRARRIEDYLLGEKEVVDRDERTGYLFIEYELEGTGQYVTTGIGLQAKRHKQLKSWGFVITDNRRIGTDMELFKLEKGDRIPFSRIELENRIADGGEVVQTNKEYMALVNKHVFGFETTEAYEDLIKLLIQLRSPKLSKDFRPTVIYEILEAALPPLTDEDLRHLSDTIEHMDQTRQHIEQVERELQALAKMNSAYRKYNEHQVASQAKGWVEADKRVTKAESELEATQAAKRVKDHELKDLESEKHSLIQKEQVLEQQVERLKSSDIWQLEGEKKAEEEQLHQRKRELADKEHKLSKQKRAERTLGEELEQKQISLSDCESEIEDQLMDLENDAKESAFLHHDVNVSDYRRLEDFSFSTWKKQAAEHTNVLQKLERMLEDLEKLKEKREEKEREYSTLEYNRDRKREEERDWLRTFEEDKQKKVEEIFTWAKKQKQWAISEELLQETSRRIFQLYEPLHYRDISSPFEDLHKRYNDRLNKEKLRREHEQSLLKEKASLKKEELATWKQKRDPEPPRSEQTTAVRAKWAGPAAIPFYEAVEFREDIDSNIKKRIEAALIDSGLLDALITEEPVQVKNDRTIHPNPHMMAHTLNDYLCADPKQDKVSHDIVESVLQSLLIGDEGEAFISEDGSYRLNILEGHATEVEAVRFIGRTAREQYRLEMIDKLKEELAGLEEEQASLQQVIYDLERQMDLSSQAIRQFPNDEDLLEIFQHLQQTRQQLDLITSQMKEKDEERKELYRMFRVQNQQIEEEARHYDLTRTRHAYREASSVMVRYQNDLSQLQLTHQEHSHLQKDIERLRTRIEEIQLDADDLQGELNLIKDRSERSAMKIQAIVEQLQTKGAEEIRREITRVLQEHGDVKQRLTEVRDTLPAVRVQVNQLVEHTATQSRKVRFSKYMEEEWQRSFSQEIQHRFVEVSSDLTGLDLAKDVYKQLREQLKERESLMLEGVTRKFHELHGDLMEYQMQQYTVSLDPHDFGEKLSEEEKLFVNEWKTKASRNIVELNYHGKQVSPMTVEASQQVVQERQQQMLNEQDKELYEEILFKSVGNKLRSRIKRAEKWTQKMNGLMESRNSSSGLTFSIRWKPKTADHDAELDTKELVELLNRKPQIMKEEDFQKMIDHFRSRIDHAKVRMHDEGEGQTLLQVLKEVLDYRKWFSFVLSFQMPSEPKKELTNNAFYKFSGGEKAMAMYIPLFASCYSRYQEASDTAPYIISLDEAFAGVDENNIREMFEIVEELGFDYIMNSQVLWGDYDTVQKLAVSELIRPKNADFVAVMNYRWNGMEMKETEQVVTIDE